MKHESVIVQNQVSQKSQHGWGPHEVTTLGEKLLATDGCYESESLFTLEM